MSKVIAGITTSVDGYIAGSHDAARPSTRALLDAVRDAADSLPRNGALP